MKKPFKHILILFFVCAVCAISIWFVCACFEKEENIQVQSEAQEDADTQSEHNSSETSASSVIQKHSEKIKADDTRNFLFLCETQDKTGNTTENILICSLDDKSKTITVLPAPTDTETETQTGETIGISEAYAIGGFELLDETAEENLGIPITSNIYINTNAFLDSVIQFAPFDLILTENEAEYIAEAVQTEQAPPEGENALSQEQIKAYLQMTAETDDESERAEQHSELFISIIKKLQEQNIFSLLNISGSLSKSFASDMSAKEGTDFLLDITKYSISNGETMQAQTKSTLLTKSEK